MKLFLKFFAAIAICFVTASPAVLSAEAMNSAECYIVNFDENITALKNGSLSIEETVTADCGISQGKHGIFRIIPERIKTAGGEFKMPVTVESVTDENGAALMNEVTHDAIDQTVSVKIGDPAITISGKNIYKIRYSVANVARMTTDGNNEIYWNLLGNFWEMEIYKFTATIGFPDGIGQENTQTYLYSGDNRESANGLAEWRWVNGKILEITSSKTINPRQGITVSAEFPAGFIDARKPTFGELYGNYLWMILPLGAFIIAFWVWFKFGKDPSVGKTVIPEFDVPGELSPMQLGLLESSGYFDNKLIPAALVGLAVKKIILIEEIKKTWALGKNDYRLKLLRDDWAGVVMEPEKTLVESIFAGSKEALLSDLKKDFYLQIPKIRKAAIDKLAQDGLMHTGGLQLKKIFLVVGFVVFWFSFFFMGSGWVAIAALVMAGSVLIIFGLLMPKRTPKGAEINWQIQGFRLYMKTAELYRQQFYEKENIFEKFLPYAMAFGMTKLWIKKMEDIYGKEYFTTYHPVWYSGMNIANFNADNFVSQMNSMSASIASNTGSPSGSHGSGFTGGGGGGGGGGSW